jgi:hypothetical protein
VDEAYIKSMCSNEDLVRTSLDRIENEFSPTSTGHISRLKENLPRRKVVIFLMHQIEQLHLRILLQQYHVQSDMSEKHDQT